MQDGTSKASLELKNERAILAFGITEEDKRSFKDYCMKHGMFMNPSSAQNPQYKNVVNVFKRVDKFNQMVFYCKPYCKAQNNQDKKQN